MKNFILIIVLLNLSTVLAQPDAISRDTSFTVWGTFLKEKKQRPYITIAAPEKPKNVRYKANVVYRTIGQRKLLLDIYYPEKTHKPKPAVLLIFGGGWRSGDKSQNHAMAIELAKHGYVAVSAEYRLSGEVPYPAAVYDLKAAVRWMRSHASEYGVATGKVVTLGCSAGGQLAALLGTTNSNTDFEDKVCDTAFSSGVQAVVDIDGTLAFHHPESSEGTAAAQWLGGTYAQRPDVWTQAAPLEHVDSLTPPFLFINSSIPRFHAGRDDMIHKLNALGIYSEVHTLEDTPHPFWFFNPWFQPMIGYVTDFLNKQFK